jgi:hypothetical protein
MLHADSRDSSHSLATWTRNCTSLYTTLLKLAQTDTSPCVQQLMDKVSCCSGALPAGAQAASHLLEASLHDQSTQITRLELVEDLLGPEQALYRPAHSDSRLEVHAHALSHSVGGYQMHKIIDDIESD